MAIILPLLRACLLVSLMTTLAQGGDPEPTQNSSAVLHRAESEGIAMEFSLKPADAALGRNRIVTAGMNAIATFRLTDGKTGRPVNGVHPKAWMSARRSEQVASEIDCKEKIRGFMGGELSARADVNLNSYLMLTLNHDKTYFVQSTFTG